MLYGRLPTTRSGCARAPRRARAKSTSSTSASMTSSPAAARQRAARSRSSSITREPAPQRSTQRRGHARRGRARSRPAPRPAAGRSHARSRRSRIVDQKVLAEALARDVVHARHARARTSGVALTAAARASRCRRARAAPWPTRCRLLELLLAQRVARLLAQLPWGRASTWRRSSTWIRCTPKRDTHRRRQPPGGQRFIASSNSGTNCPATTQPRSPPWRRCRLRRARARRLRSVRWPPSIWRLRSVEPPRRGLRAGLRRRAQQDVPRARLRDAMHPAVAPLDAP